MLTLYILYVYFGYLGKPIELIFLKEKMYFVYHQVLAKKKIMKKAYFVRFQKNF